MGKVKLFVKYCLINEEVEYNINGILIDNQLKFLAKESKMLLNLKSNVLKRITESLEIIFDFNEKICFIIDKSNNTNFSLDINLEILENENGYFYVKYKIEEDKFEIRIQIV